ncbi:MAG TPA: hypothetical protein VF017_07190 [Thermoanaerobaculia bacterium]|nr:hypothetical protein [Thermoanaerobaculia bacterium]
MVSSRSWTVGPALCCLLLACGEPGDEIAFRFEPQEGSLFAEERELTVRFGLDGQTLSTVVTTLEGEIAVNRPSSWQWAFHETLTKLQVTVDRKTVFGGPATDQNEPWNLIHEVWDDGTPKRVVGREKLVRALQAAAPSDEQERCPGGTAPGSAEAFSESWLRNVTELVDITVEEGAIWDEIDELQLDCRSSLPFVTRYEVVRREACPTGECVVLQVRFLLEPETRDKYVGKPMTRLLDVEGAPTGNVTVVGLDVQGRGEETIDLDELLRPSTQWSLRLEIDLRGQDGAVRQMWIEQEGESSLQLLNERPGA